MSFVVDASLAFKWVLVEADSDRARAFYVQNADQMHAPDLVLSEVCHSLVRRVNERVWTASAADAATSVFLEQVDAALLLHRVTPSLIAQAVDVAIDLGHPLKDCVYLALADQLGCPLATCDAKFHARVGDPDRVKLLAELV